MIFDRVLTFFFKVFVYFFYRKRYGLSNGFRFNGYFIRISGYGKINTGSDSYISFFSYVNVDKDTTLTIGDKVSIAHNVKIYTSGLDTESFILKGVNTKIYADVKIGNNVLIGSNSFICPGVNIGDNVVIGANSVVSKDIPANCVAAGAPAKAIKMYAAD